MVLGGWGDWAQWVREDDTIGRCQEVEGLMPGGGELQGVTTLASGGEHVTTTMAEVCWRLEPRNGIRMMQSTKDVPLRYDTACRPGGVIL